MDSHEVPERAPTRRRKPLSDTTAWVNNQSSTPPQQPDVYTTSPPSLDPNNHASSQPSIPHHESLAPGGNLQVRNKPASPSSKAEDKRISAISSEDARNSNRDSQISNSTNASGKSRRKTHVGPWRLGATIGKGATGRVRKARHAITQQDAAIKIVSKKQAAEMLRSGSLAVLDTMARKDGHQRVIPFGIEREVVIMKLIEHPNVIKIYDVWENRGELYLVLEYVQGGELFDHIVSNRGLPESEAIRIFRQMIAGLSYCHRFSICHRDLKPENILMDSNRNIKIVDFGMAALQPAKQYLKTACGSPHYAAPEVIRSEGYSGDKADIWSCGVILYAMIVGTLPFDGANFDEVIQAVLLGEYETPPGVSDQAADLIWRMLQPNPKQRIPLKKMWHHPLIQKYANLDCTDAHGKAYIGPAAPLTANDCGPPVRHRNDIDAEILRNLQNLWHGASQEEIAQRLLNDIPNHEKVLYTKLLKFREEQLEHYDGHPMDYSISDYHHIPPPTQPMQRSSTRASLQTSRGTRRVSQYALVDPNMPPPPRRKTSRTQSVDRQPSIAETEGSYDPFNPARTRIASLDADHARITVLRGPSRASSRVPSARIMSKTSLNVPSITRALTEDDAYSIVDSPPTRRLHSADSSRLMANRHISRASSRLTMASRRSVTSNSSVIISRRASSYKRNVSFVHNRNRPVSGRQRRLRSEEHRASPFTLQERYNKDQPKAKAQDKLQTDLEMQDIAEGKQLPDSPTLSRETPQPDDLPIVRSRKAPTDPRDETQGSPAKRIRLSHHFRDDARKVSLEMEKLCEEAFNRPRGPSVGSRNPTPQTVSTQFRDSQPSYRTTTSVTTPDTSFSVHEDPVPMSITRRGKSREISINYNERPLPQPPATERKMDTEHLGSYTQRELQKTRELLIKRRDESMIAPGYLDDVIAHLDRLMQPSAVRLADEERRAISTPDGMPRKDTFEEIMQKNNVAYRSASEPQKPRLRGATIRLVEDSDGRNPISPVKPLTIRKKSASSTPSGGSPREITPTQRLFTTEELYRPFDQHPSAGLAHVDHRELDPIEEDEDKENFDPSNRSRNGQEPKKRNWFRRHQALKSHDNGKAPPPPAKEHGPLTEWEYLDPQAHKRTSGAPSEGSQNSEPNNHSKPGKSRFFKIFGGKRDSKEKDKLMGADYDVSDVSSIMTQDTKSQQAYMTGALQNASHTSIAKHQKSGSRDDVLMPLSRTIQPQHQNWFARFLRIKPAVSVMCFQVSKVRARKEVTGLFKDWKRYGMKDVVVDKVAGRIWARVDGKNSLQIPSLSLAAQFHTLLHRGRRSNLAIARFTQEKGAKSSFERVVAALEEVLKTRGLLVEDKKVVREMRAGAGM